MTSAKANRDFVMKQMSEAVNAISGATQATGVSGPHPLEAPGALATALDDFDVSRDETKYVECPLAHCNSGQILAKIVLGTGHTDWPGG